jgi:hypothetical protein
MQIFDKLKKKQMKRTILYYPTIDIPADDWLRNALLYWDEVSSIVPESWDGYAIELSPDIHYLKGEGQFRPISPDTLFRENGETIKHFESEFFEIIESKSFMSILEQNKFDYTRIHREKMSDSYFSRVHRDKLTSNISDKLEDLHLINKYQSNGKWLYFENNTALLYMSLLAKYLADIDSESTIIGTDNEVYENFNFKSVDKKEGFPVVSFNLNNILPTPKDNVPFEKIIDFKRKRKDNLLHFRKTLSDFQTQIAKSTCNSELKNTAINFQETLSNGVKDLGVVLSDAKIDYGLKSVKSLLNIKSPTVLATIGTFTFLSIPLPLQIGIISLVGTFELTANYIENRNKDRAKLRESPFSYIYYAQKERIVEV